MSRPLYNPKEYVEEFFPDQELFSVSDVKRAYADGMKVGSSKTLACWVSVEQPPTPTPNRCMFVMCFTPENGIDIVKILTTDFAEFMEYNGNAYYWCYESVIATKKIRQRFKDIMDESDAEQSLGLPASRLQ